MEVTRVGEELDGVGLCPLVDIDILEESLAKQNEIRYEEYLKTLTSFMEKDANEFHNTDGFFLSSDENFKTICMDEESVKNFILKFDNLWAWRKLGIIDLVVEKDDPYGYDVSDGLSGENEEEKIFPKQHKVDGKMFYFDQFQEKGKIIQKEFWIYGPWNIRILKDIEYPTTVSYSSKGIGFERLYPKINADYPSPSIMKKADYDLQWESQMGVVSGKMSTDKNNPEISKHLENVSPLNI